MFHVTTWALIVPSQSETIRCRWIPWGSNEMGSIDSVASKGLHLALWVICGFHVGLLDFIDVHGLIRLLLSAFIKTHLFSLVSSGLNWIYSTSNAFQQLP